MSATKLKAERIRDNHDRYPETSDVGVGEWELAAVSNLTEIVSKALTDTIRDAVNEAVEAATEYNVEVCIPVTDDAWDGTLEIGIPLGPDDDSAVYWKTSIDALVAEEIGIDEKNRLQAIRAKLQSLVDELDAAIATPTPKHPELEAAIERALDNLDDTILNQLHD